MKEFEGKVAIVTGGTSGIGRATAIAFAREGAKVAVTGRREEQGNETVKLIEEAGGEGVFIKTDIRLADEVKAMLEKTIAKFGRLDFAFNNAGVEQGFTAFPDLDEKYFDKVMDTNVKGVWLSMKYQIPEMLKAGGGAIVNCASVAGVVGMVTAPVYVASKHAVVGLTKAAALEYGKQNIRINAVLPGGIETPMIDRYAKDDATRKYLSALHPIGRLGSPEEIAAAVIWLCSEKSSFVVGHSLLADGGWTVQ